MKVSIIGLGLIGGSFSLALKKRFEDVRIFGWDTNPDHAIQAKRLNIVDQVSASLDEALEQGSWIFLAVPVHAIEKMLPEVLTKISSQKKVVDFGSTKATICHAVRNHEARFRYIAAHPIAGTEYSGPEVAFAGLFEDKVMVICERELSGDQEIDEFRKLCKILGMTTTYLSPEDHDIRLAYMSHLSHVIAYGLSNTVLKKEESDDQILNLAGSGLDSMVRLAKSSPEMWTPIMIKNRKAVLESLHSYLEQLTEFGTYLDNEDEDQITNFLRRGREIRRILK